MLKRIYKKIIHKFLIINTCIMLVFTSTIQKSLAFDFVVTPTIVATVMCGVLGAVGISINADKISSNLSGFVNDFVDEYSSFYGGLYEDGKEALYNLCGEIYAMGKVGVETVNDWLSTWLGSVINSKILQNYATGYTSCGTLDGFTMGYTTGMSPILVNDTIYRYPFLMKDNFVKSSLGDYYSTIVAYVLYRNSWIEVPMRRYIEDNRLEIPTLSFSDPNRWGEYYLRCSMATETFFAGATLYNGSTGSSYFSDSLDPSEINIIATGLGMFNIGTLTYKPGVGYVKGNSEDVIYSTPQGHLGDVTLSNDLLDLYDIQTGTLDLPFVLGKDVTFNPDGTIANPGTITIPQDIPKDDTFDDVLVIPETGVITKPGDITQDDVLEKYPDFVVDDTNKPDVIPPVTVPDFEYGADWTKIFPFCIPFDLFKFIGLFCAEPETPKFTYNYNFMGIKGTMKIDLTDFDPVAKTCRTLFDILFIVGLAMVTRNQLIKG